MTDWIPTPKQEQFIELPFSIDEALFGGAAGGGKSDLLIWLPIIYRFYEHPKFKALILRRTYKELEKEIIIRATPIYEKFGGVWKDRLSAWKFPSNAYIFCGYAQRTNDVRKYDTAEFQLIEFDELTSFEEFQYKYMFSRLRYSRTAGYPDLPTIVRSATNPGNVGHEWVKRRFVAPNRAGGKIIADGTTKTKRFYLHANVHDNPYIDPNYVNKLELLPDAEKQAKLYGNWDAFAGQVFGSFREKPYEDEPENAKHVIEPFPIPDWWPQILSIDWGTTAMTVGLRAAISPQGQAIVNYEYAVNGGEQFAEELKQGVEIYEWASEIGQANRGLRLSDAILDSNAWDNRVEGITVVELVEKFSGLKFRQADKGPGSRIQGRALVQEFLRWKSIKFTQPKTFDRDYAEFLLKTKGVEAERSYLDSFRNAVPEILPRLLIFNTCKQLIKTIPSCVYDPNNPEDVAEFPGDDPYDCLRYLIRAVDFYTAGSKSKDDKLVQQHKLDDLYVKNPTAFYIMKQKNEKKSFGVRRYRRRI